MQSEQLKPLLSLYIKDTVEKGEARDYTRLAKMEVQYLEQTLREKHSSSNERRLENPASGGAAANSKSKRKRKCWKLHTTDVRRSVVSVQLSKEELPGQRSLKGTSPSGKENQPTCYAFKKGECPQGDARDSWHPVCSSHQIRSCELGHQCAFKHTRKAGGEPKKRMNSVAVAKTLDITHA